MLSDYFVPHASGGVERAAYEVSRRIARQGHDVTVLTFRSPGAAREEEMDGLHVVRVPALDVSGLAGVQLSLSLHVWPAVRRLVRERRIDLLHVHGLFFHASLAAAVLGRRTGIPIVTTAHVGSLASIGGVQGQLSSFYERSVGRFILGSSHQIIAVSEAVAEHVRGLGAADGKLTVVANGVDMARHAGADRCDETRPRRIVFVGRLIANKGPQFLLDALPGVVSRFPDAECWFAGDGPMRRDLERRVREQRLEGKVRFLGERDDVPELLSQCDVLVRPSLSEGLPLAVLEAMASGLAVVATRVGGTPELVEDGVTGFLIDPGDRGALGERLCRLLADRELCQAMGERGRQAAAAYDWDVVSDKTLDVYMKALVKEEALV